jgi:hypothetical protein
VRGESTIVRPASASRGETFVETIGSQNGCVPVAVKEIPEKWNKNETAFDAAWHFPNNTKAYKDQEYTEIPFYLRKQQGFTWCYSILTVYHCRRGKLAIPHRNQL